MSLKPSRKRSAGAGALTLAGLMALSLGTPSAQAASSAPAQPDLISILSGYSNLWKSDGKNDLHGTIVNGGPLQHNDALVSWINQHATKAQQFRAMQNSAYTAADGSGYDQSMTIADGLGGTLGQLYVQGRLSGKLPLTSALVSSETGSAGAFVSTGAAKAYFSHPRPYLQADPKAAPVAGDTAACAPSIINSSSLVSNRIGKPWADSKGNLKITRIADVVDKTHQFSNSDVSLTAQYGQAGLCTGGSFPSGHTTTAYQAAITLATLVPEVAPTILSRASEAANNRIVLGVHYPLDIIGGRMNGEASLATLWSDANFRTNVLEPARKELVSYLTAGCEAKLHVNSLAACVAADTPYRDNPYGGARMPGGSAQIVTNRASAVSVYTERMSYAFAPTSSTHDTPVVPTGASNLLLTAFPTLSDAQRTSVLAQTEIASGNPLAVGAGEGWQRINLAAATSATVEVEKNGSVKVLSTGGTAKVIDKSQHHHNHRGHHGRGHEKFVIVLPGGHVIVIKF